MHYLLIGHFVVKVNSAGIKANAMLEGAYLISNSKPRCSTSGRKSSQKTSESNGGVGTVGEYDLI